MTVTLGGEHVQLRETAREFARRELEPHAEAWDRERRFPAAAVAQLAELGFLGLLVPEEEGGSGFDTVGFCLAVEEVSRAVPALGVLLSAHNGPVARLVSAGPQSMRETWLPRLVSGRALGAMAVAEADAGSDASALRTHADDTGAGELRLSGRKAWVAGAGVARACVVFARRDGTPTADAGPPARAALPFEVAGLSPFLVDLEGRGVAVGPAEETMGLRALPLAAVTFEGTAAEAGQPLDRTDRAASADALGLGRLGAAAQALGVAGRCLELAVAYAAERRQFGRPIAEFQGVRLPLADLGARLAAARALLYAAAAQRDGGAPAGGPPWEAAAGAEGVFVQATMAKLAASELAMATALQAVQTFGGYGYIKDYPVERFFRDAKACQLYEGTNEIQRLVIAHRLFG